MFIERKTTTPTVKILEQSAPRVFISTEAISKMKHFVDKCQDEIGWLGTAYRTKNNIIINDVFLFDQEVHATTTEITPEGLSEFAEELLQMGDIGIEIWNNLKVWGHSHVNMSVSPSSQDDKQMLTFKEGGHDWFIRIIANKKGDMKVDVYDYEVGIIYLDVPWVEFGNERTRKLQEEIRRMEQEIEQIKQNIYNELDEVIEKEIKEKVRKKNAYTTYNYGYGGYGWYGNYGKTSSFNDYKVKKKETEKAEEETITEQMSWEDGEYEVEEYQYAPTDLFATDDDVIKYMTNVELADFSMCEDWDEITETAQLLGYYGVFSKNDLERIFRVSLKVFGVGGRK